MRTSYVERRGRCWYLVYPAAAGEGIDTERGPFFTRIGLRWSRLFWGD